MRIRMLVQMTGTRNGQPWPEVGKTADILTGEALHLVASGVAEQVTDKPDPPPAAVDRQTPRRKRRPAEPDGNRE